MGFRGERRTPDRSAVLPARAADLLGAISVWPVPKSNPFEPGRARCEYPQPGNRALPVSDGCRERRTKRIWAPRAMAGRERSVYSSEPHHVLDAVATGRRITAMAPTAASRIVPPIVTGPTHIGPRPSLPAMPSTQPPTTTRRRTTASGPSRTREMGMFGIPTPPARPCSSATEILPGDAAADVEQMVLGVVECVSDDGGGVDHQLIDVNGGRSLLVGCE